MAQIAEASSTHVEVQTGLPASALTGDHCRDLGSEPVDGSSLFLCVDCVYVSVCPCASVCLQMCKSVGLCVCVEVGPCVYRAYTHTHVCVYHISVCLSMCTCSHP